MKYMVYYDETDICDLKDHANLMHYWNFIENLAIGQSTTLIEAGVIITRVK